MATRFPTEYRLDAKYRGSTYPDEGERKIMNPEEQRIVIAEARHQKWDKIINGRLYVNQGTSEDEALFMLPDPLSDLNAMHEAEKGLTSLQQGQYTCYLGEMNGVPDRADWENVPKAIRAACFATASQRAEAFCRVKFPEKFK